MRRLLLGTAALAFAGLGWAPAHAQPSNISQKVAVCDPKFPTNCTAPFTPDAVNTATLSVSASSGRVALPGAGQTVILTNNGASDIFVKLGDSTVTATTSDFFIGSGRAVAVGRVGATYVAAITGSSTSALVAQTGTGTPSFSGGGGSGGGGGGGGAITAAAGSYAVGALLDGASVTQGAKADSAWVSGSGSEIALLKAIAAAATSTAPTPVKIDQTTLGATNAVQAIAGTTGGANVVSKQIANNTTSVAICASACTYYGVYVQNNSADTTHIAYLKLYNTAQGSVTCGTPTPADRIMIPSQAGGSGAVIGIPGGIGVAYGTALTACVTTGFADNDTTAPAANVFQISYYVK